MQCSCLPRARRTSAGLFPRRPRAPTHARAPPLQNRSHETTAAVLTWALFSVAQAPEVEARLLAEIDSVVGDRVPGEDTRGGGGRGR